MNKLTSAVKKATSSKGVISKGFKIPKQIKGSGVDAVIAEMEGKVAIVRATRKATEKRVTMVEVKGTRKTVKVGSKEHQTTVTRKVKTPAKKVSSKEKRALRGAAETKAARKTTVKSVRNALENLPSIELNAPVDKVAKKTAKRSTVKATTKRPVNAKVATRRVAAKFRAFTSRGGVRRFMGNQVTGKGVEFIYGRKDRDGKTLYFPIVTALGDMTVDSLQAANIKVDLTIQTV